MSLLSLVRYLPDCAIRYGCYVGLYRLIRRGIVPLVVKEPFEMK